MAATVVLLNRVLRVRDHPALVSAARGSDAVVPLFVFDPAILRTFGAPNRVAFLLDAAILHHRHVAALPAGRLVAAHDGAQTPHLAADLGEKKDYFVGLPIPPAAVIAVGMAAWAPPAGLALSMTAASTLMSAFRAYVRSSRRPDRIRTGR